MKIMFSAGEASGDTHAASVAKALRELYPNVDMLGMGGTLMERAGVRIVYDIKNLGIIGIVEIIKSLPKFFELRTFLKRTMIKEKPKGLKGATQMKTVLDIVQSSGEVTRHSRKETS